VLPRLELVVSVRVFVMRLSFNPHRHAFVAFSLACFRVKSALIAFGRRRHSIAELKLQEIWETSSKEMPE
jgi:hypothetical protein